MESKEVNNKIYLNPGDLVITSKGKVVWTLLGSCVSIIFYSPLKKISAICHAQLPYEHSNLSCKSTCPKPCGKEEKDDFKYVTCSFKYMLEKFQKLNIDKYSINASLFGGASLLNKENDIFKIGESNINKAKELILKNKLKLVNENTGGHFSRTLTHYPETGKTELILRQSS